MRADFSLRYFFIYASVAIFLFYPKASGSWLQRLNPLSWGRRNSFNDTTIIPAGMTVSIFIHTIFHNYNN
jgi:hypothetical protein